MPSYPVGMSVSSRALTMLADSLRKRRAQRGTRWRRLDAGEQALLVVAYLRKGETYEDLAAGFGIGTTTVFRYVHEGLAVLAAMAPTVSEIIEQVRRRDEGLHVRQPRGCANMVEGGHRARSKTVCPDFLRGGRRTHDHSHE